MEYEGGFEHCVPLNPSEIARNYPALYLWGLDESLLDIVETMLGLPLTYHGVIARKELVDGKASGSRLWHRDAEDHDVVRISIYLTDVLDEDDGPFEYVPLPLTPSNKQFAGVEGRIDSAIMNDVVPENAWRQCLAPAGSVIFASVAKIYHHGRIPRRPRCAASYYYTSRHPYREELCRAFSFRRGMPFIDGSRLSQRQRECVAPYAHLLAS